MMLSASVDDSQNPHLDTDLVYFSLHFSTPETRPASSLHLQSLSSSGLLNQQIVTATRLHSGALLEVQGLPADSLERPERSLASLISQSQDIPEAKHVSKFSGFMLIPSASISLGLEIPGSGGTLQAHWDDESA